MNHPISCPGCVATSQGAPSVHSPIYYQICLVFIYAILLESELLSILRKIIFWAPNGSRTHDPPEYQLEALTTELWETRGEEDHILGSYMCDTCPAILQGLKCHYDENHIFPIEAILKHK